MNTKIFFKEPGEEPVVFRGTLDKLTAEQQKYIMGRPIFQALREHTPIFTKTDAEYQLGRLWSAKEWPRTIVDFEETEELATTNEDFGCFLANIERHNSKFSIKTEHGELSIDTYSSSSSRYILTLDTLDWIPEGYHFPDSDKYELHLRPDQLLSDLPAGVSIEYLIAKENKAKSLPENLTCDILAIGHSYVEVLPKSLHCQHIFAGKSALRKVETTEISEFLDIDECRQVIEFPAVLSCKMLSMENCGTRHLPQQMPTCKALMLTGSSIEELPEGLDLDVLAIDYCFRCKAIPDGTKTESLSMDYSGVTHIGDNVTVRKDMDLSCTKVEHIGKNCSAGNIVFSGYMTEMPENLQAKNIDTGAARLCEQKPIAQSPENAAYFCKI